MPGGRIQGVTLLAQEGIGLGAELGGESNGCEAVDGQLLDGGLHGVAQGGDPGGEGVVGVADEGVPGRGKSEVRE